MFWKVEIHIKTPLFTNIINSNFLFPPHQIQEAIPSTILPSPQFKN